MDDTNTVSAICQDPKSTNFTQVPQFIETLTLDQEPPSIAKTLRLLHLEQTEENCQSPRACGHAKIALHSEREWDKDDGPVYFCNKHSCPASRIRIAYRHIKGMQGWEAYYWLEITDGTKYKTFRDQLNDWHIKFVGIPSDHGTVFVFLPTKLRDAQVYEGGWYQLFMLVAVMPEHMRVRKPYVRSEQAMADEEGIGVRAAVQPTPGPAQKTGIPLAPTEWGRYVLGQWSLAEQIFLFAEAGHRVVPGNHGGFKVRFDTLTEDMAIEELFYKLSRAPSQYVLTIRERVRHELRLAEPPPWVKIYRRTVERCPETTEIQW